jgi:hypothetical protein
VLDADGKPIEPQTEEEGDSFENAVFIEVAPTDTSDDDNVDDWEEIYSQYAYIRSGDAKRKWGIVNEDDGLLLLVSLTFEALRERLH